MEIWCKPYLRFVQSHEILSFVDWQFDISAAENSATSVSEDGGIRFFRNVANEIIAYTASHLRRASHMWRYLRQTFVNIHLWQFGYKSLTVPGLFFFFQVSTAVVAKVTVVFGIFALCNKNTCRCFGWACHPQCRATKCDSGQRNRHVHSFQIRIHPSQIQSPWRWRHYVSPKVGLNLHYTV